MATKHELTIVSTTYVETKILHIELPHLYPKEYFRTMSCFPRTSYTYWTIYSAHIDNCERQFTLFYCTDDFTFYDQEYRTVLSNTQIT